MTLEVLINGTNRIETLGSSNDTADIIGNWGGFQDGSFVYDHEHEIYCCDQETYDWWDLKLEQLDELDARIDALENTHGWEAVWEVVYDVLNNDLEDYIQLAHEALDEAFGALDEESDATA